MRLFYYLLTFICGAFGVLSLVRVLELLATRHSVPPMQVAFAAVFLYLGVRYMGKARAAS